MEIITKHFYSNGKEMKQHDLVYLEGFERDRGGSFKGFCRLAFINGDRLTVYPLGHTIRTNYTIEIEIDDIDKLIKMDSKEIDRILNEAWEKAQKE